MRRKIYGSYQTPKCVICGKIATGRNGQGLEICRIHKEEKLDSIKCTCGSWLDIRQGKFGSYFNCMNCGNISFRKAMEIRGLTESI